MSTPSERIFAALPEQDDRGVRDFLPVGGAAIALAYDERGATRDVDAVFVPKQEVYTAAARTAAGLGLPRGWLNDAMKGFLQSPDRFATTVLELPGR